MISGASYNVFNGEEHLLNSLRHMSKSVDYINIVVQYTSNLGNLATKELEKTMNQVESEKLADEIFIYTPNLTIPPVRNEHRKRSIGLEMAKNAGVTHFMTMDCDEYYKTAEFLLAKEFILENGIQASAVATYLHIKRPIWRSKDPDTTCCSFLTQITKNSEIEFGSRYPVMVDPTRRLHGDAEKFYFFDKSFISMKHMNLVRYNLNSKLANSSNANDTKFMAQVRESYEKWKFGEILHFPNKPPMEIIEVDDLFGIDEQFV